ncbi:MAG: hypothetical protein AVDCRST_MAG74-1106 [uncultured Pyrinomonadaceae bacterium]|uniref:phosphoribosylanthranilate isomerase n=1 Tax=uncultured Pyrinomonadaceae bacterium TaxID=2283094 RepID=A0A6J4NMT2_9BACT|nr:MAG: hypothetical protein AVDCRST_MAG74-1106 [uncultured Pyrinomonadaceae bacterium]
MAKKVQEIFPKMYLAGGLSIENVRKAILQVKPFAVDSCSSVEEAKGIKNHTRVKNFIFQAR